MKIFCLTFILIWTMLLSNVGAEVNPSANAKLQKIEWVTTSPSMKMRFSSYFEELINKPWDALSFKIKI